MLATNAHFNVPTYAIPNFNEYRDTMADLLAAFDSDQIEQNVWSACRTTDLCQAAETCATIADLNALCDEIADDVFLLTQADRQAVDSVFSDRRWKLSRQVPRTLRLVRSTGRLAQAA